MRRKCKERDAKSDLLDGLEMIDKAVSGVACVFYRLYGSMRKCLS